jgi:tryptophan synthase alpha chain
MSYYNPIFVFGLKRFLDAARSCGVDGIIVCDLPLEEAAAVSRMSAQRGIRLVSFIAPTTSRLRARKIARQARGFIYYISLAGTTGARARLPLDLERHLRAIRGLSRTPVCAGFGISTPAQVRRVGALCDGVIVGSAIVSLVKKLRRRKDMPEKVGVFVRRLQSGR